MEQVKRPLLVHLAVEILLGIIGISAWGVGFISQSAWARLEKDDNLVEVIQATIFAYAKPLKVAWGVRNWTLESNKHNHAKEMDVICKYYNFEIVHEQYVSIFYYYYYFTLFSFFDWNIYLLCVTLRGTTKEAFVVNVIHLPKMINHRYISL
jgi:hypothetical protein